MCAVSVKVGIITIQETIRREIIKLRLKSTVKSVISIHFIKKARLDFFKGSVG